MSLVLQSSGGGQITIQEPATASNFTQTLPAATGTVMVSGNQPAFSAAASAGQSLANGTWTKIQLNTEVFDTASAFDSTTNYRFTPLVAGYYQINGLLNSGAAGSGATIIGIYKNGSEINRASLALNSSVGNSVVISVILFLNGSSDYVELYGFQNSGGAVTTQTNSLLSGSLVRAA
jgi:hypothetical protein